MPCLYSPTSSPLLRLLTNNNAFSVLSKPVRSSRPDGFNWVETKTHNIGGENHSRRMSHLVHQKNVNYVWWHDLVTFLEVGKSITRILWRKQQQITKKPVGSNNFSIIFLPLIILPKHSIILRPNKRICSFYTII